ncbi:MAG: oligosaccharide flippase family protein [Gaiellales bacterium]
MTEPPAPEPPARSLASATGILFVSRLVANAGYFVAVWILARSLGPEGRGAVAFVTVSALVASAIAAFGVPSAITVLAQRDPDRRAALLSGAVTFTLVVGLVVGASAFGGMVALGAGPDAASTALLLSCIPAVAAIALFDLCVTYLVALGRTTAFALLVAVAPWLYAAVLALVALIADLTIPRAIAIWLVTGIVSGVVPVVVTAGRVGIATPDRALTRESVTFGFRAWIGSLAGSLNFRLDQILMGLLATDAALGVYALAVNVSEVLLYVPAIVGMLLVPLVARTPPAERTGAVTRLFRQSLVLTAVTCLGAAAIGPVAIPFVFGDAFRPSVTPFLALLPGAFGFAALRLFSSALVGSSRPGGSSVGPVVALVAGVALDLALIPPYGATGAAIAASGAFLAGGAAAAITYRRETPYPYASLLPSTGDARDAVTLVRRALHR